MTTGNWLRTTLVVLAFTIFSNNAFAQAPTLSISINPSSVEVGEIGRFTFHIDNSGNARDADNVAVSVILPDGVIFAPDLNIALPCGGSAGPSGTIDTFGFNVFLRAGESCAIAFDFEGANVGLWEFVTSELTSSNGTSPAASSLYSVGEAGTPNFSMEFSSNQIETGQIDDVGYFIDNSANGTAANLLDFSHALPAGLIVATPPNVVNNCTGGTLTAVAGSSNISYTSGSVAASATCLIQVDVEGTVIGDYDTFTTSLISDLGDSGPGYDSISVIDPPLPSWTMGFIGGSAISIGETATISFSLQNLSLASSAESLQFVNTFPSGLQLATPDNLTENCPGTVTTSPSQISFDGSLAPQTSCNIQIDVEGIAAGLQVNTTGDLTSTLGNSGPVSANITVAEAGAPLFTKQYASPTAVGFEAPFNYLIDNSSNGVAANNLDFTEVIPAGLIISTPPDASTTCTGGVLTAVAGTSTISYTGGSIGANATCSVIVDVVPLSPGDYDLISGDLTSSLGNSGPSIAFTHVVPPPILTKEFETDFLSPGGTTRLRFFIDHIAGEFDAGSLEFTDTFPAGLVVATSGFSFFNCDGGTLTAVDGAGSISYSGGSIERGQACQILVTVEATSLGVKNNVSSELTSDNGVGAPATDTLEVIEAVEWDFAGPATWFDATNWSPEIIPLSGLSAGVNNGGTALVDDDSIQVDITSLFIGVDGGSGTVSYPPGNQDSLRIRDEVNIGVTLSGANTSTGRLEFLEPFGGNLDGPNNAGPLRIGVTQADGNADGTYIASGSSFDFSGFYSSVQLGVSDGAGSASATILAPGASRGFRADNSSLEIGVAKNAGAAMAMINGGEYENFSTADIGVSNSGGNASAMLEFEGRLAGPISAPQRGPINIGVSHGTGTAHADIEMSLQSYGTPSVRNWTELSMGVANSTGDATGHLQTGSGVSIPIINIGLSPGGGMAAGSLLIDHGLISTDDLTLGTGSSLQLNAHSDTRATGGSSGRYSAVDAAVAALAGELAVNLMFVPTGPTTFEMVNTTSPTGITGLFDTLTVNNLPSGMTASQSVQLDGSNNEQLVVDLLGTPDLPVWTNPTTGAGAGDWFEGGNWSSGSVPLRADSATVANGGEAVAGASRGVDIVEGTAITIGLDGNDGLFTSNGVDTQAQFRFLVGHDSPNSVIEQTATGTASINNADLAVAPDFNTDLPPETGPWGIGVGYAQGDGTAVGSLLMEQGNISSMGDIWVGAAVGGFPGASSSAQGDFVFNGSGTGTSSIATQNFPDNANELFIAYANDENAGTGANLSATATAQINNTTIDTKLEVAKVDLFNDNSIGEATAGSVVFSNVDIGIDADIGEVDVFGENSTGTSSTTTTFSNVIFTSGNLFDLDSAQVSVDGTSSTGTGQATVNLTDVVVEPTNSTFDIGEANASGGGEATSIFNGTWLRTAMENGSDLEIAFADSNGNDSEAHASATMTVLDSDIIVDELQIGEIDISGNSTAQVNTMVEFNDSSLTARRIEMGQADMDNNALALLNLGLRFINSTIVLSDRVELGRFSEPGGDPNSLVRSAMRLTGSSLVSPEIRVGLTNVSAATLESRLRLNPSLVDTEALNMGEGGSVLFGIEGLTRVTAGTVGGPGTYAAIDATDALLAGEIIAHFDFIPPAGTHVFDFIVTDSSTALDDSTATFIVEDLVDGFVVDSFGVVNGTTDIVRLQISGTPNAFFQDGFEK